MNTLIKKIKNIYSGRISIYTLMILYYGISFFVPNNKALIALSALFVATSYLTCRSWATSLIISFFVTAPIGVGQAYKFIFLKRSDLFFNPLYPEGRVVLFSITANLLLGATILCLGIYQMVKQRNRLFLPLLPSLFFLLVFIRGLSSLNAEQNTTLSRLIATQGIIVASWLFLLINTQRETVRIEKLLLFASVWMALSESTLVIAQMVRGGPLGIILEQRGVAIAPEMSVEFFRPFGLASHPNFMAQWMLFLFFVIFFFITKSHNRDKKLGRVALFGVIISIALSQSRAAYLGLIIGLIPLGVIYVRKHKPGLFLVRRVNAPTALVTSAVVTLLLVFVLTRGVNTLLYSAGTRGPLGVRRELEIEALRLIQEKPLLGVGPGMFIPAAYKRNVTGIMNWFPEAVHNGLLLLAAESGVVSAALGSLLLYLMVRYALRVKDQDAKATIIGYVFSHVVFAFFHPVNIMTSLSTATMVFLLESSRHKSVDRHHD